MNVEDGRVCFYATMENGYLMHYRYGSLSQAPRSRDNEKVVSSFRLPELEAW